MLVLRDISKVYTGRVETVALRSISLTVGRGEFLAVVGPSGSGKSTLMNIIGLLDRPTTGRYWIDDREVTRWSDKKIAAIRNRTLGFVHQSFNLIPTLSARENVELPLVYRRVAPRQRRRLAAQWLSRLGLEDRIDHRPQELSGGQQQRVALARALVASPKVLLADEPTGNLDDVSARDIMRLFAEINDQGQTIVLITHDRRFAKEAHRVVTMADGSLTGEEAPTYANG